MSFIIQSGLSEHSTPSAPSVSPIGQSASDLLSATTTDLKAEVAALEATLGLHGESLSEEFGLSPRSKKNATSSVTGAATHYEHHLQGVQKEATAMAQGSFSISSLTQHTTGVQVGKAQTQLSQSALSHRADAAKKQALLLGRHSERARGA